ncbi:MAG: OB-fold domain-containing protein [Pseudomonadales bacterium]
MSETNTWLPAPDESNEPFFAGARAGELRMQHCTSCGGWVYPVKKRCQHCGGTTLEWKAVSGRGKLYSHARLAREYHPRHRDRLPLILAWIDLEEGVRMPSNLVGCEPADAKAGMAVQVDFEHFPDGGVVPVFRPA